MTSGWEQWYCVWLFPTPYFRSVYNAMWLAENSKLFDYKKFFLPLNLLLIHSNMALAITLVFLNFLGFLVNADLTDDLNLTRVKTAQYDELYTDATYAYNLKDFCTSAKKFDQALADYKHENKVKIHCREKCYKKFQESLGQRHIQFLLEDIEVEYFRLTVYSRRCTQRCVHKYLGQRSHVTKRIKTEFETRRLYQFLHFAYYKVGLIILHYMMPFWDL